KAIRVLIPLSKASGESKAKEYLLNAHWGRAEALFRLGRYTETVQDADRALECDDGELRATIAAGRAVARAFAGDFSATLAEAKDLAQEMGLSGPVLHDLARVYSVSAAAASQNHDLPFAERDRFAKQAAAESVALLVRAKAAGYFQNVAQIK